VHFYRNVFSHVPNGKKPEVARMLKAIHAQDETLTYYAYPSTHWRQIRTSNPPERIIREIRRRTRVVGAFPDGNSALDARRSATQAHRIDKMGQAALSAGGGCSIPRSKRQLPEDQIDGHRFNESAKDPVHYPSTRPSCTRSTAPSPRMR